MQILLVAELYMFSEPFVHWLDVTLSDQEKGDIQAMGDLLIFLDIQFRFLHLEGLYYFLGF